MWMLRCALIATLVLFPAHPFGASTFVVTKTSDTDDAVCDGDCSLREAVGAANNNAGSDDINVPAGNYLVGNSDISIDDDVAIQGSGQLSTIIDSAGFRGAFRVLPGVVADVSDVTIQNGNAYTGGGAFFNRGTLTITDSTLYANEARERGGAIWNTGGATVHLINSTVSESNVVFYDGGGIYNDATSTVTLTNSTLSGNSASDGAGIYNHGTITLVNSTVSGNMARSDGGGFYNSASGAVTLTDSTISGNSAAKFGGAGYNYGTFTLTRSTVSGNSAVYGGGFDNEGTLVINNSTLSGNTASSGGAIYSTDDLDLLNTTISGNAADFGSGLYTGYLGGPVKMEIENSIVADNGPGGNCDGDLLDSLGHNLVDDASCAFAATGDLVVGSAQLGPLADNGGPTETHALLPTSAAIDAANPGSCPATDQRGETRPFDGDGNEIAICDIGSVEYLPEPGGGLSLLSGALCVAALYRRRRHRSAVFV